MSCVHWNLKTYSSIPSMMENPPFMDKLMTIRKSDIPVYLQNGAFYKSLGDDDDDCISVPAHTLKPNALVSNNEELYRLLLCLRHWKVDEVVSNLVLFCLQSNNPTHAGEMVSILRYFRESFPYLDIIMQMIPLVEEERTKLAINSGILELVTVLHESCCALPDGCHVAARARHLHILQYLHQHGGKMDTLVKLSYEEGGNATYACACSHAAAGGNLECLKYLHEQGCPWGDHSLFPAIYAGHTACVEYALQHGCKVTNSSCSTMAAEMGFLHLLKLLHTTGAPWDEHTCSQAAYYGHLDCLQYLHENGCPWNVYTTIRAAEKGHFDCLSYAHENGCELDKTISYCAVEGDHLECLKYAYENGCTWNAKIILRAARKGHLSCLQFALEQGCDVTEDAYTTAVELGNTACAAYLQAHRPDLHCVDS